MDQVTLFKQKVRQVVEYIASISPSDEEIETQAIMDDLRGHYLLFSVGWDQGRHREYSPFIHVDVKPDGKVWIQHDGTSLKVALMLAEEGIPKSQIVLAFKSPSRREDMPEFAQK